MTEVLSRSLSTWNIGTTTKLSQNVAAGVTKPAVTGVGRSRHGKSNRRRRSRRRSSGSRKSKASPEESARPDGPHRYRYPRSSDERGGGGRGRSGRETLGDLLEGEVVPDLQEGGEGPLAGDPRLQVVIGAAEAAHDIEHQDPIGHRTPEVVKSISHALHPPAELTDGEVLLLEGAEAGVELESAELGVAEELPL